MMGKFKQWWRGRGERLAFVAAIMLVIFGPYFDAFHRAIAAFHHLISEDFPIAHLILFILLALTAACLYPFSLRFRKQKKGALTPAEAIGLVIGVLGISLAFFQKETREQVGRVSPLLTNNFPAPHLIVGLYLFIAWEAVAPLLRKRRVRRRPTFDVSESVSRASDKMCDHMTRAVLDALGADPNPVCTKLAASVITKYGSASAELAQYETRDLMLMGNFSIYARCVKAALDFVSTSGKAAGANVRVKEACIYTLLRRPLVHWYNPLAKYLPDEEDGITGNGVFTRPWWESYKARVAKLSDKQKDVKISMKRLILQQREQHHGATDGIENYYVYTDGTATKHKDGLPFDDLPPMFRTWGEVEGYPHMTLLPEIKRMAAAGKRDIWPRDARLHIIGQWDLKGGGNKPPPSGKWTQLNSHFENAYHTTSVKAELAVKGKHDGIFYGYIKKLKTEFRDFAFMYEDIFLVKLKSDEREESAQYFGMAFVDEKTGDEVGIRFLDSSEVKDMVRAFEKQWQFREGTLGEFCYCAEEVS